MENLDTRIAIYEYLRDNLSVEVSTETGIDYYTEYTSVSASVRLKNPVTGDWVEVASDNDCIY
ncbi:MAG: hypothetical protein P8J32_03130 [bacterium]|nr:hypothetical protein [bacterium]